MRTLTPPELVTNRDQARALVRELPSDLTNCEVEIDCSSLKASTPSFVDELVKSVLVERGAHRLTLNRAPERVSTLAQRFAFNHGVADRVAIAEAPLSRAAG